MFLMVGAMKFYVDRFTQVQIAQEAALMAAKNQEAKNNANGNSNSSKSGKEEGIMEGFYLFYEHDYVKGIFVISSLYMVQVTIVDYMMKVFAKDRYTTLIS